MHTASLFHSTRFLIIALVACSIFALLAVAGLAGLGVRHVSNLEDREVREGISLIEGAYQLKTAAIQEVLAVRDYALTGNPGFLVNAHAQSRIYSVTFESFSRLDPYPEDVALLEELRSLDAAFETFEGRVKALKERRLEAAAVQLLVVEGKPLIDRWIVKLDDLIARQEHHVANVHHRVVATQNQIFAVLTTVSMTAIPLTLVLGALALWRLLRPLAELEGASRAIAAGRLAVRVPTRRDDEFGAVGRAFNTMADRVQHSLQELTEANAELKRVDRYKDEFLSMVSHELRTPLSFIKGFAGVLDKEMAGPLTDEQRSYVENILSGADRMLFLVNDLLDLATIQAGKLKLAVEPQPFGPLVEEVLASMRPLADAKHVALAAQPAPEQALPLDRQRILQVLTNLVANAIKFTPGGGSVEVRAMLQGDRLRCEVVDTGLGIAAADLGKLFQRFSQLDMSVTRKSGGTGLGLSISKALVEAHGGTIGVESVEGQGSTFWFELPLQPLGDHSATSW